MIMTNFDLLTLVELNFSKITIIQKQVVNLIKTMNNPHKGCFEENDQITFKNHILSYYIVILKV